jgi:hypothetical protein
MSGPLSWHDLWAFVCKVVWPAEEITLRDWGHFIEATVGLNVAASIYRERAKVNLDWLEAYLAKKKAWLRLACETAKKDFPVVLIGALDASKESHRAFIDIIKTASIAFSIFMACCGVFLLYLTGAHPGSRIPQSQQFFGALLLALPLPFALLAGLCHRVWISVAIFQRLLPFRFQVIARGLLTSFTTAGFLLSNAASAIGAWFQQAAEKLSKFLDGAWPK